MVQPARPALAGAPRRALRRSHWGHARLGGHPRSGYRWASCNRKGALHFHWRAICLPPRIIDYLVAHELEHLCAPHRDSDFWRRLESAMPNYAARKHWLAEHGGRF